MTFHASWADVQLQAVRIADTWRDSPDIMAVLGVPRGGLVPAAMVATHLGLPLVEDGHGPTVLIVDDLIDSGATRARYDGSPFDALYRKAHSPVIMGDQPTVNGWIVFPWERDTADEHGPGDAVVRLLEHIGEDPTREGLHDTPRRVLGAFSEMTSGYGVDVGEILTRTFASDGYGGLVVVRGVDFVSLCEHHLLTFTGTASVGYIPGDGRVVGLSKLARVVDVFAHRLQVQERMTEQIADAIAEHLDPEGIGVVVRAQHSCLACRGARKANAEMVTSSLRGALYDKPAARAEFMALTRP